MGRRSAAGLSRERLFTTRAVATGVVPACASLDCVTVFAPTVAEGATRLVYTDTFEPPLVVVSPDPTE